MGGRLTFCEAWLSSQGAENRSQGGVVNCTLTGYGGEGRKGASRARSQGDAILARGFVVACGATAFAVIQPVFAEADIQLPLAKATILLTLTPFFSLFALATAGFGLGGHRQTVSLDTLAGKRAIGNLRKLLPPQQVSRDHELYRGGGRPMPTGLTVGKSA